MSYTEEVYERVVAQNPGEPEFHQAVKEVLDSLKVAPLHGHIHTESMVW